MHLKVGDKVVVVVQSLYHGETGTVEEVIPGDLLYVRFADGREAVFSVGELKAT